MQKFLSLFFVLFFTISLFGQSQSDRGFYLVEFDKFSPPTKDLIKTFEGFPATPFMANDIEQVERSLTDFKGSVSVLLFMNTTEPKCLNILNHLKVTQKKFKAKNVKLIAMMDEDRTTSTEFFNGDKGDKNLIVIPNTRMLSEAVYGVELGYPRIFIIDTYGIVQTVIPEEYLNASSADLANFIEKSVGMYVD